MGLRRRKRNDPGPQPEHPGPTPGYSGVVSKIFEGDLRGAAGHAVVLAAALLADARGQTWVEQAGSMVGEAQAWMQWAALVLEHEEKLAGSGGLIGLHDTTAKLEARLADLQARIYNHLVEHHAHEPLKGGA